MLQDVGHAVLESYSRLLESLAAAIMNRIDDVFYADSAAAKSAAAAAVAAAVAAESNEKLSPSSPSDDSTEKSGTPTSNKTLLDFMGWNLEQGEENKKECGELDEFSKELENEKIMSKTPPEGKKISYLERLEQWGGLRSPTARH